MGAPSVLLGAVLTFHSVDGRELALTVSLTEPATAALTWGSLARSSTPAALRHVFAGLPAPREADLTYRLAIGAEPVRVERVRALGSVERLTLGVYGDSRDGSASHAVLVRRLAALEPEVLVHTGDVIATAHDREGWVRHLASTLPLSARVPLLLCVGNHELQGAERELALSRVLSELPMPADPLARELGAPPSAYRVKLGPVLFVALDSNAPLGAGSPQLAFLDRALAERGDVRHAFVCYHHGPLSSGPHGAHPDAEALVPLLERHRVSVSIAGHDHTYERLVRGGVAYLVAGGGGAPLYPRERWVRGSQAFLTTYNAALLRVAGASVELEAYSLEGVLIDRARLQPDPEVRRDRRTDGRGWIDLVVALSLLAIGLCYAFLRITSYQER